jgi:hypothetical protein
LAKDAKKGVVKEEFQLQDGFIAGERSWSWKQGVVLQMGLRQKISRTKRCCKVEDRVGENSAFSNAGKQRILRKLRPRGQGQGQRYRKAVDIQASLKEMEMGLQCRWTFVKTKTLENLCSTN